jgi:hypothetical protein
METSLPATDHVPVNAGLGLSKTEGQQAQVLCHLIE